MAPGAHAGYPDHGTPAGGPAWRRPGQACYNQPMTSDRGGPVAAAPFRGLRFDPAVVGDLGAVTAPPYDMVPPDARGAYEARSPYNVVRLTLARGARDDPARYDHVPELIGAWRDQGALLLDPAPALYLYEEAYLLRGARQVQRGVLATVTLDDTGTAVLPHERTMAGLVADRLRLLETTRANLSPLFGVYAGGGRAAAVLDDVSATTPAVVYTDEAGVEHRLWPVTDPDRIAAWREQFAGRQVLIADGHHRYQASLRYRDAMRAARPGRRPGPWDEVLMFLVDADQHGPSVLPVHRLLADLPAPAAVAALAGDFEVRESGRAEDLEAALAGLPTTAFPVAFGLYGGGRGWLLVARDPGALAAETGLDRAPLDVEVLHGPVLAKRLGVTDFEGRVAYEADLARAARRADQLGRASVAVLRAPSFQQVVTIARGGDTLPQKTTSFLPKPRDGLVLRPLDPAAAGPG
jgi:uncharacterized protein (DUF1015 family)